MEYIKSISLKSLLLALLVGHAAPYILLIIYSMLALNESGQSQSMIIGSIVTAWLFIFGPLFTGYIAAKYSKKLPMFNGMFATSLGIALYFTHGEFALIYLTIGFVCLSLFLGYIGANKYVRQTQTVSNN